MIQDDKLPPFGWMAGWMRNCGLALFSRWGGNDARVPYPPENFVCTSVQTIIDFLKLETRCGFYFVYWGRTPTHPRCKPPQNTVFDRPTGPIANDGINKWYWITHLLDPHVCGHYLIFEILQETRTGIRFSK